MSSQTINSIISSVINSPELSSLVDTYMSNHMEDIRKEVLSTIRKRLMPINVTVHNMEDQSEEDDSEQDDSEQDDSEQDEEDNSEEDESEEDQSEEDEDDCDCECENCKNSQCEECHEADYEWIWNCCDKPHAMDEGCKNCKRWYCECDEDLYDPIHRKSTVCKKCGTAAPTKYS